MPYIQVEKDGLLYEAEYFYEDWSKVAAPAPILPATVLRVRDAQGSGGDQRGHQDDGQAFHAATSAPHALNGG